MHDSCTNFIKLKVHDWWQSGFPARKWCFHISTLYRINESNINKWMFLGFRNGQAKINLSTNFRYSKVYRSTTIIKLDFYQSYQTTHINLKRFRQRVFKLLHGKRSKYHFLLLKGLQLTDVKIWNSANRTRPSFSHRK